MVKISDFPAFSPFESVPDSRVRSTVNLKLLKYVQAQRVFHLKNQINFWNRLTFFKKTFDTFKKFERKLSVEILEKLLTAGHL